MWTGTPAVSASAGARVAQDVQRSRGKAGPLALLTEPLREPLRMDRPAERVGEHEVEVGVGIARERTLDELRCPVLAQRRDRIKRGVGHGLVKHLRQWIAARGDHQGLTLAREVHELLRDRLP